MRVRDGVQAGDQLLGGGGREIGLEAFGQDASGFRRAAVPVLGYRPVPVGKRKVRKEILQVLLEFVEIRAMPGQEPLPAMLAVVLVNKGLVVVAAAVRRELVDIVDLTE